MSLLAFLQGEYPVGQAWGEEHVKDVHSEPVSPRGDASYAVLTEVTTGDRTRYRIYTGHCEARTDPDRNLYWSSPGSVIYNPHDAAVPAAWLDLPLDHGAPTPDLEKWTTRAAAHARKITSLHTPGSAVVFKRALIGGYFYRALLITEVQTTEDGRKEIWVDANGKRLRLPDEARHGPFEVVRLGWPERGEDTWADLARDDARKRTEERHLQTVCNFALSYSSGRAGLTSGVPWEEATTEFNPLFAVASAWALNHIHETSAVTPNERVWTHLMIDGVRIDRTLDTLLYGPEEFDVNNDLIRTLTPFGKNAMRITRSALRHGERQAITAARQVMRQQPDGHAPGGQA